MAEKISSYLTKVVNINKILSFTVRAILMDMEFEKVSDDMKLVQVNTTESREHVGQIEQGIIVVKEQAISVITNLLFT